MESTSVEQRENDTFAGSVQVVSSEEYAPSIRCPSTVLNALTLYLYIVPELFFEFVNFVDVVVPMSL